MSARQSISRVSEPDREIRKSNRILPCGDKQCARLGLAEPEQVKIGGDNVLQQMLRLRSGDGHKGSVCEVRGWHSAILAACNRQGHYVSRQGRAGKGG